jgi:lactoylglutathione lyase
MSFLWTTIHVADIDRSIAFYEKFIGLKVQKRYTSRPGVEIAFLGEGETKVEFVSKSDDPAFPLSDQISISFSVENLDAKIKELKSAGIPLFKEPVQPNPHIRFCYIKDPDGVSVQFAQLS